MDIDRLVLFEALEQLLGASERLLEGIGVRPGEVGCVRFWVEVVEGVRELDLEVLLVIVPGEQTLAPFPLHGVGADAIDRPQAHLVELALLGHALDVEVESLATLDTPNTEVEPTVVVASLGVRQPITRHIACVGVCCAVLRRIAPAQVA